MRKSNNDSDPTAKRSYRRFIVGLTALAIALASQAQDFARLSERTIMGTARYVGMGGAMTAVGGDPSAVLDNVAALGIYRRPEAMITFDYVTRSIFMAPQASAIFCMRTANMTQGVLYHNFMIGYHRVHCFNASMKPVGEMGHSLGTLIAKTTADVGIPYTSDRYHASDELSLKESGYVNEYTFDWAMNISHRWYFGLGLRIQSYHMASDADYIEWFNKENADLQPYFNRSQTSLLYDGVSCAFATGILYRPLSWLRFGFGLETPSLGRLYIHSAGRFYAQTDSLRRGYDAPDKRPETSAFHMPLRLSTSVAFQIKNYAMIALQYNYRRVPDSYDIHSLRAGVEIVPYPGLYINAGYVFESPFKSNRQPCAIDPTWDRQDTYSQYPKWQQYISGGVGYRGRYVVVQAAYQYALRRFNLFAHENAQPYLMEQNTHRIVLTLAWRGRE